MKIPNWKKPRRPRKPKEFEERPEDEREFKRGRWQRRSKPYDDYSPASLRRQNEYVRKIARDAGLIKQRGPVIGALPPTLCQKRVAGERLVFERARRRFKRAVRDGHSVFLVTVIHPAWVNEKGKLAAASFRAARDWFSRRCRNLAGEGCYFALGVVDVAWMANKRVGRASFWSVHIHALVLIKGLDEKEARKVIKRAIGVIDGKGLVARPRDVSLLPLESDVEGAGEYVSSKLMFECRQRRVAYIDREGQSQTRKQKLPPGRAVELLRVTAEIEPQSRLVLSRLRRTNEGIAEWKGKSAA